jgi:hypothetical protein
MFLGFPDPDPLVRGIDPDPVSSKNSKKNLDSFCFVTSFGLFIFEKGCNVYSKVLSRKTFLKFVFCWRLEDQ